MEMSGTSDRLMMDIFTRRWISVIMQNCEMSELLPAVLGMKIIRRQGAH